MIVPPFESDVKKSTGLNTPKTSIKSTAATTSTAVSLSSKETSVTPRQRPKACQLNPVNANQFQIGLPPSPSPRNVLSSPIDGPNFKAPLPSKTPENFNAQFDVDFTNIDQHAPVAAQPQPVISTQQMQIAFKQQQDDSAKFDNLFKSAFPDPFEQDDEIVQIQTNYVAPQQLMKSEQLFESILENQQQVTAKVSQHRRYMSDTSGFKR